MRAPLMTGVAVVLWCATAHAEPPSLQSGLYEIRLQTRFADGQSTVPVNTVQRCVSATEIAEPQRLAPQFSGGANCVVADLKVDGNRASWTLTCAGPLSMRGTAQVNWSASAYEGETRMLLQRDADRMQMTQSYTARRLGGC